MPMAEFLDGVDLADMSHKTLGFVSGGLRKAQTRWPIVATENATKRSGTKKNGDAGGRQR